MSCCEVLTPHVDALIAFGLQSKAMDSLRWFRPSPREPHPWELGRPWAPAASDEYADRIRKLDRADDADEVGRMIFAANYASLEARYGDEMKAPAYRFRVAAWALGPIDPVKILGALTWYEYQTCEAPGWAESEAFAFCRSLQGAAVRRLPGYEFLEVHKPEQILIAGSRSTPTAPVSLYGMRDSR